MAVTALLVDATPLRLRYAVTRDTAMGSTLTIPNAGGASPDLRTDAVTGCLGIGSRGAGAIGGSPMLKIMRAGIDGYGPIAAGGLNQAQARALLLSDDAARAVLVSNLVSRCFMLFTPRTAIQLDGWLVDANVDGGGDPVIDITAPNTDGANAQVAYLDIYVRPSQWL